MIISPDSADAKDGFPALDIKAVEAQTITVNRMEVQTDDEGPHSDPPPAYSTPPTPPPPLPVSHAPPPPADIRPTNLLSVTKRDGHIRGKYVLDPKLKVPPQMLAPLDEEAGETEETRRNLWLHTRDGFIDADVWVLSDEDADCKCRRKARLGVNTKDGHVSLRLHSTAFSPHIPRTPLSLSLHTHDGHVRLALPRAFTGPLTIRLKDGRYRFSPALSASTTVFSESKGIARCFVGDFAGSGWADAPGDWTGDDAEGVRCVMLS
uniref:DUF7330 domain-containing protein n=1 Tax=Mycena chlorophos TaxID=658473 RepID=A0ABQ0L063_MYCCL|nr:predicted protein [Mycena chlorophos]